jgi:DNA-binding winged helix-turn-helix (wHTH) protein
MSAAPTYAFGPYLFIPSRQLLLNDGKAVRIGGRALDLLMALVNRPGQLLSKKQLLEEAWPSTTVVEGNLKVHIGALRRALEDDAESATYIATVNGRGYRFVAPVETGEALTTLAEGATGRRLVEHTERVLAPPSAGAFEEAVALLSRAMGSRVIDLPAAQGEEAARPVTRRVLFIELTARDEALIEALFTRPLQAISAAPERRG